MNDLPYRTKGIEAVFLARRPELLAFLKSRNAGDAAEDMLQELWLRLPSDTSMIQSPLSYLYRMANSLVIDAHCRDVTRRRREKAWSEAVGPAIPERDEQPSADRLIEAREIAAGVLTVLAKEGPRVERIFRRHRIDGLTRRDVAAELGVSISTVEGDLRRAYRALSDYRQSQDEASGI